LSSSWSRRLGLLLLLASSAALAQEYAGTWVAKNSAGAVITLRLQQDGPGGFTGTLEGSGHKFDVEGEIRADGILGLITSEQALVHLAGRINDGTLFIVLREPGPDGQPDDSTRRVIRFSRKAPTSANERRERLSVRPGGQGPG
jgi:hypothetical protein